VISRATFVALALAAAASGAAPAQSEFDPAQNARDNQLRVLLGPGAIGATNAAGFVFNGRSYRGRASQLPDGNVVNTLSLEQYLYSVVPREMTPAWPAAALQAQAVCARTYVLQRSNPRRDYDVTPSELDQVYGGYGNETPLGRAAVDASAGMVLRYGNAFAQVLYSSCCGGHTEASSDAWGGPPFAYLGGVLCTTCTDSPYYRWHRELELSQIAAPFGDEVASIGALRTLAVGDRDASGRAREIVLQGTRGSERVRGSTFRLRVGPRVLPSLLLTKIDATAEAPERVVIEGGGLGHGVGLCQWGARGLALAGASVTDILKFYFPGTVIDHD
jgi:stage II sporulation protein D